MAPPAAFHTPLHPSTGTAHVPPCCPGSLRPVSPSAEAPLGLLGSGGHMALLALGDRKEEGPAPGGSGPSEGIGQGDRTLGVGHPTAVDTLVCTPSRHFQLGAWGTPCSVPLGFLGRSLPQPLGSPHRAHMSVPSHCSDRSRGDVVAYTRS